MERKESLTDDSLLKLNNLQFKSIKLDTAAAWSDWSDEEEDDEDDDDDASVDTSSSSSEIQNEEPDEKDKEGEEDNTSEIDDIIEEDDIGNITRQYLFIQMEFCSNRTLKDEIYGDTGLTTDRAWALFREILEGLNYIHGKKTIHRDLKPGNIFLDSAYRAKIGDFGLAREHS